VRAEVAAKARPGGCSLWGADPLIDAIYPNGITTSYAYDTDSRLTNLRAVLNGTTTITSFGYSYDAAGNRTSKQQLDYTEGYSYDPLYRLTGVERTGPLIGHWHYGYDPVGNRTSSQLDNAVTTAAYNEKNQLLSSSGGGPLRVRGLLNEPATVKVNGQPASMLAGNTFEATIAATPGTNTLTVEATDASGNVNAKSYQVEVGGSGATYSYDPGGNLATKTEGGDTWGYVWNVRNELTRVTKNGAEQARFAYDPRGRRVEKVAGGATTSYTYDGKDVVREVRGTTTLRYIDGSGFDEPLAMDDGTALSYFHADGLGSIARVTNASGAVTLTRQYDAWGNLEVGASEPGYAFTGREWDPQTGLYYYRARYYDPKAGRFASEDPFGWRSSGDNFYRYVDDDPVNGVDPLGLYTCRYYILNHTMTCAPSRPRQNHPTYTRSNWSAGQNAGEDPTNRYSECNDCRDNPKRTNRSGRGPAPENTYNIGPAHGPGRRRNLAPWNTNTGNEHGRGGRSELQIHFCPNPANCSTGCIANSDYADFQMFNDMLDLENVNVLIVVGGF